MTKNSCPKKRIPTRPNVSSVGKQHSCRNCATTVTPVWRRSPTGGLLCNACGLYLKLRNTHRKVPKTPSSKTVPPVEDIESCASSLIDDASSNDPDASDKEPTMGTCPGDGFCNGTGGTSSCVGCPVLNNRLLRGATKSQSSHGDKSSASAEGHGAKNSRHAEAQDSVGESTCHNCKTSITSMWRRDNNGYRICNPCGLFYKYHGYHKSKSAQQKSTIRRRKRVAPATPPDDDAHIVFVEVQQQQQQPGPSPVLEKPAKNAFPSTVAAPFPHKKLMTIEPEPGIYSSIPFTSSIFSNFGDHQKLPQPTHNLQRLHDRNSIASGSPHRALVSSPPPRPSIT